jgi:hypothetical protein
MDRRTGSKVIARLPQPFKKDKQQHNAGSWGNQVLLILSCIHAHHCLHRAWTQCMCWMVAL